MTVRDLSEKTGIVKGTLDSYLSARASMPPADIAVTIARALGVSVEYLVTGADETPARPRNASARAVMQILDELTERDKQTMLGVAKVLKKQETGGRE